MSLLDDNIIDNVSEDFFKSHISEIIHDFIEAHRADIWLNPLKNTGHICKYKLPEDVAFVLMKNVLHDEYDDDSYLTYDNYGFEHRIIYVHLKRLLYPSSQYPSFQYQASKIGYCMLDMGDGINRRITVKMIKDWFIDL